MGLGLCTHPTISGPLQTTHHSKDRAWDSLLERQGQDIWGCAERTQPYRVSLLGIGPEMP